MSAERPGLFRRLFGAIWGGFKLIRNLVLNVIFLMLFVGLLSVIFSGESKVEVPPTAALVLKLNGDLVEEQSWVDPVEAIINESAGGNEETPEILVRDLVKVIKNATNDSNIKVIVLALSDLRSGSIDKLQAIGVELEKFKAAGKKIYATGNYYSQNQYFLASFADSINLQPGGTILLEGYGSYPMYYRSALEKLKVTTHVFKVGTYKSAVEPFLRDDMSPEAKEANSLWLNELWSTYKTQVAARRGFDVTNFDETFSSLLEKMSAVQGDVTQYALQAKLVDTIKTREGFQQDMIALVGANEKEHTFNQVHYEDYRKLVIPAMPIVNPLTDKVALVVARGNIVDGSAKAGTIGGDSTARLLRRARYDDKVKAVVLRIDSGGGSKFASEIIAEEIKLLKEAGKPVIASMGAVAASGGYWIAASANEIWAAPTTITGSIGIFAMFPTAEKAFTTLGLNVDGVGTTELAGFSSGLPFFQGLTPDAEKLMQMTVERGYDEFISFVGQSRNLEKVAVDKVGQGHVWTGTKALEFGLVDKLGTLDDAIAAAAAKASLSHFDLMVIEQELTPQQQMLKQVFGSAKANGLLPSMQSQQSALSGRKLLQQLNKELGQFNQFNDPNGVYSYCFTCAVQ
ncbi:MAG: signal peptide peptidase SppA [Gammaproteobacteria bacterium]|nr:signal peptide peptidase SppA [Gammaproteobacteria bacterium]MBU2426259.1 signal peptide peptidase SppA [Gammaproteobacteria bacterium]